MKILNFFKSFRSIFDSILFKLSRKYIDFTSKIDLILDDQVIYSEQHS